LSLVCAAALFTHTAFAAKSPPPPPPPPSSGTLVLAYSYPGADSTDNWGLSFAPSGTIYASGITFPGYRALVLGSSDSGRNWSLLDAMGADAFGNLYVVGRGTTTSQGNNVYHWLVRKSSDGGNSWTTVDDFQLGGSVETRCFAAKSNGDLYVAGVIGSYGAYHWCVRKNVGGIGTWSTIDDYQYAAGKTTEPHAMAADAAGNLFVGGSGQDALGNVHWLIKKY